MSTTTASIGRHTMAFLSLVITTTSWADLEYEFTLLQPLPGGTSCRAQDINNAGTVAGESAIPGSFYFNSVCWLDGRTIEISGLGISGATASSINDAGTIVGMSDEFELNAYSWSDGVIQELETTNFCCSKAFGINESGVICGHAPFNGFGAHSAAIWIDGVVDVLDGANTGSTATDINERGEVVGNNKFASAWQRGFHWENGIMTELLVPSDITGHIWANAINDRGVIVGHGGSRGLRWQNGDVVELDPLSGGLPSSAADINNDETIVGYSYGEGFTGTHACRWINGQVVDLNELIDDGAWTLVEATAINDQGQIVGHARRSDAHDEIRAYVLSPISQPCPGDLSNDGVVDVTDLLVVIGGWGEPWDVGDLLHVIEHWGSECG